MESCLGNGTGIFTNHLPKSFMARAGLQGVGLTGVIDQTCPYGAISHNVGRWYVPVGCDRPRRMLDWQAHNYGISTSGQKRRKKNPALLDC